jgi:hypothetical protein
VKAVAEDASSAESPSAAAATCTTAPVSIPSIETIPARRHCPIPRMTM